MRSSLPPFDQHSRIPLTVIGGSARSGKTSLVRHLLEQSTGRRVAAVVADYRAIDPALVERRDGSRFLLRNGCLCVVAEDDGAAALADLAEHPLRPDHVVIDREGTIDPRRLSGYGYMPGYSLDGTIVVLDACMVHAAPGDPAAETEVRDHANVADVVLLNKIDLIDEDETDEAQRVIERLAPSSRIVCCDHGRVSPPLLLGAPDGPDSLDARAIVAQWTPDYVPIRVRPRASPRGARLQTSERHRAWCLVTDAPVDGRDFREWVHRLPPLILNGRGTVYLREEPQHRQVFHLLGSRWRLERGAPWGRDVPSTRLLLSALGGARRLGAATRARLGMHDTSELATFSMGSGDDVA
jgi:G3E family GTPase